MSDRSTGYGGARSNPLYGQRHGSGSGSGIAMTSRAPSWARRPTASSRASVFSDGLNSPPDSPSARDQFHGNPYTTPMYEHPGYTVETPMYSEGASASPYHAPPYFVQTPAQSERGAIPPIGGGGGGGPFGPIGGQGGGGGSPYSSAPSSPRQYGAGGYDGSENRGSARSGLRVNPNKRGGSSRSNNTAPGFNKIDEVEDDEDDEATLYPDPERDAARKRRWWKCCMCWSTLVVVLLLLAGAIAVWDLFSPSAPSYSFGGANITEFNFLSKRLDSNGLATDALTANVTIFLVTFNPNHNFGLIYKTGSMKIGYSSIKDVMYSPIAGFTIGKRQQQLFSTMLWTLDFPLYAAGPSLAADFKQQYTSLDVRTRLEAKAEILWKVFLTRFVYELDCTVNFNPMTKIYINNTCSGLKLKQQTY